MLLPGPEDGFEIVKVPDSYKPEKSMSNLLQTGSESQGYQMPDSVSKSIAEINLTPTQGDLPAIKPEEYSHFAKLL
jgi:splicing factor 3B subunit 1